MQSSAQTLMNYSQKNRMVLRLYWIATACVVCMQILYFVYFTAVGFPDSQVSETAYIKNYILAPALSFAILGLILTFLCINAFQDNAVLTAGLMMAGLVIFVNLIICFHYGIAVVFAAYIFPIILSLFYNSRKMTLLTAFFVLVTYTAVATLYLPTRNQIYIRHSDIDMVAMPVIIILMTVAGMRILEIYSDLIDKIVEQTIKKIALEREAKEDSLTKLYNHALFYDSLDFAISSHEEILTPFCAIIMDIDDFKRVNDTYGHDFGDIVLLKFSDIVRSQLDENDTAFRYGGEEFSIISFRSLDEAVFLAEQIRMSFADLTIDEHPEARFTVSIGVSEYSRRFSSKREFFANADRALYAAKRQGKNQTVASTENDRQRGA